MHFCNMYRSKTVCYVCSSSKAILLKRGFSLCNESLEVVVAVILGEKGEIVPLHSFCEHNTKKAFRIDAKIVAATEHNLTCAFAGNGNEVANVGYGNKFDLMTVQSGCQVLIHVQNLLS